MKIESLKTSPDRAGRYWAVTEDGTKLGLYRQTVEDFAVCSGRELTDEEWEKLLAAHGEMSAKMRAVRIVSASGVSRRDLQERLVRKGEDPDNAQKAVVWMEELHLIDDRTTAVQIVRNCAGKGYGLQRAKQALFEKRIPKELWEEALADYPDQSEAIEAFLRTRLHGNDDRKQIQKAVDALLRRGHSYSEIRGVLNRLSLESEDFPEEF